MNKLARITSIIFVPPSFTLIVFTLFAIVLEASAAKRIAIILTAFVFGFSAQIILFLTLRKKGKIIDLDASIKDERTFPFFISAGIYLSGLIILIMFKVNIIITAFWFCYISNTLITILINKHWKISVHSMGAAGALAAVTYVFGLATLLFIPVVILVGWSRVQLKCHTVAQVIGGILFAFASTYLQMYFIIKLFTD